MTRIGPHIGSTLSLMAWLAAAFRAIAISSLLDYPRRFAGTRPVHGECGGYMVLGESLEDAAGKQHAMAGLLGHATSFARRKLHLGYRTTGSCPTPCSARRAQSFAATNFTTPRSPLPAMTMLLRSSTTAGRALGKSGGQRGRVTGTFFHAIAAAGAKMRLSRRPLDLSTVVKDTIEVLRTRGMVDRHQLTFIGSQV